MDTVSTKRASAGSQLIDLCRELSSKRRLFLASNRGPIEYRTDQNGNLRVQRGSGGVVTALNAVSQHIELTWFASALGEGDRRAVQNAQGERLTLPLIGPQTYLRFIVSPRNVYHKYYNIFCNPLLWFLQHYMWNSPYTPNIDAKVYDAWENGYVKVNEAFANTIIEESKNDPRPPIVFIQDYHLYLVGKYLRQQMPEVTLLHFTHIPWPAHSYWLLLPPHMRKAIFEGLCACDIVGLQTSNRDVPNFLHTCEALLQGAVVDFESNIVTINNHITKVKAYPISVDIAGLQKLSKSNWIQDYKKRLAPFLLKQNIVRVDRTEPSKNIVRGFKAFDLLLDRHPELKGNVRFLAFLVPSRTRIKQYQRYNEEVLELVSAINYKHGSTDWQPIKLFYENNYPQAIAAMCLYDVLLVNAVIDGMNLVAKEGPIVNERNGVLVLSEAVGAHEQLKDGVLTITPVDTENTAQMLYKALSLSAEDRKRRSDILRRTIRRDDLDKWLCHQLADVNQLLDQQAAPKAAQLALLHL
ncbi:trehalose-6-phosphate synthase [Chloroflexota bacterium]